MKTRAVFFDRDGVINKLVKRPDGSFTSPWNIDEFQFLPYVKESIKLVKNLGFVTFIVTNQPGVYDNDMSIEQLQLINNILNKELEIEEIVCALDKATNLYKPENGMIEYLINKYNVDRDGSYIIGDRWKDIVPGINSNIQTIFVGKEYNSPLEYESYKPDYIVEDILSACCKIMEIEYAGI